ncbi:hypothetical protein EDB85DRAFT_2155644 [Lactarius pseudohatsudake]|nr:hypothetical protein EDB85DRAFT_2155644 [Lactarius pseudohatsudake]
MEANWGLRTFSNVYFAANATSLADVRLTNITSTIPGPLNVQYYVPIMAPNASAVGTGGGPIFVVSGVDTGFTAASVPAAVNLTAQRKTVPGNDAAGAREGMVGAAVFGASYWRCDASSGLRSGLHATREQCWFTGSARTEFS